ncbi:MAG: membrane dipeptidase [Pseudomonadota bacterium]
MIIDMTMPWADWGKQALKRAALERMATSGYSFVSLTVGADDTPMAETLRFIAKERRFFAANSDRYQVVETAGDIPAAKAAGKLAIGFHFQGTRPVEKDLGLVEVYYRLGIRHMLLAYNQRNFAADGCHEPADARLSGFGVALVREMNRVGMLVDCSHTGIASSLHAMEVSSTPVIFSHSNAKALREHPRNLTKEQIDGCVASGGVIGVNGMALLLRGQRCDSETLAEQVEHYAEVAGIDHVGLGLDYVYDSPGLSQWIEEQGDAFPSEGGYHQLQEFAEPEQVPELAAILRKRGFDETAVAKVLGGNWFRLFQQVWK